MAVRIDRLLVHTIVVAGLVAIVAVVYLSSCSGSATRPTTRPATCSASRWSRRSLAAIVALPARRSLDEMARRRVYGERRSPDEAIQTFGSRMSRAVPMDELLLQLAESLKLSMQLVDGRGVDRHRRRARPGRVGARPRSPAAGPLDARSCRSSTRARVSGNAWLQVWVPSLVEDRGRLRRAGRAGRALGDPARADRRRAVRGLGPVHRRVRAGAHRARPPGRPRAAQRPPRLRAAGQPRDAAGAQRGAARRPGCASSPRPTSRGARSSATSTTARSSTSSRWR